MPNLPYIERVNEKSIRSVCSCGTSYNTPLNGWEPAFIEAFGEYENFHTDPCPTCGTINVHNMNIPETEFCEQEIEEAPFMPWEETDYRHNVRALMWKVRPDLKQKDRANVEALQKKQVEEARGLTVKQLRQEAHRAARLTGLVD